MRRLPIRLRVTLVISGAMAIVLIALGLFLYLRFESQLNGTVDEGLRSRADAVTALVGQSESGLRQTPSVLSERDQSFSQILTTDGTVFDTTSQLGRSPVLDSAELSRASQGTILVQRSGIHGLEGQARLLATPVQAQGQHLIVVVGSSLEQRDSALGNLATLLLLGGPAALLLASLAGYLAAGTALRPVEAIRRRAAEISTSESDQRLPVPPANDELTRLGETLNEMLGRLQTALERERSFVDDASHELRTPLASHKTELELALRYGESEQELRTAIGSAVEEADHLNQLAEDLLVLARAEKGSLSVDMNPTAIGPLFETVGERFENRAEDSERRLVLGPTGDLHVEGDRFRLEQALTNLVENAFRHGRGEIRLSAREEQGIVELRVSDDGPGFPPEFLERAFERFSRAEAGRTTPGTGLGLAIVHEIALAHGGSASAANRPEGGADVWIEVPVARAQPQPVLLPHEEHV